MASRVLCLTSSFKNGVQIGDMFARAMSTASGKKVGFIGLGNMGGHMASNLMKKVSVAVM